MVLLSLSFLAIWAYISFGRGFLATPVDPRAARTRLPGFGLGLLGYLIGIALAFVSAPLSLAIYGLMAIYYLFDHLPRLERKATEKPGTEALPTTIPDEAGTPSG
jgi:hypothetical protein